VTPGVGIVGCGVVGCRRAGALGAARLIACTDQRTERAESLAREAGTAEVERDWRRLVTRPDVNIVVVATTNDALAPVTLAAVQAGKHVLVEKPAARVSSELPPIVAAAAQTGLRVRVGFNHRYHPALQKARELVDADAIGPLMFVRGRYGHGGRVGYEKEWRADPVVSGGGELIDQGVHLIDLGRWLLGDFNSVNGFAHTYFWEMPVDDNAFMLLRTPAQQAALLHVSCTEWKNLFSFEIYGRRGKIHIEGLGGSYGVERATLYQMRPEMGPPDAVTWEYPGPDRSWQLEFTDFLDDIRMGRPPAAGLVDARAALLIVEEIYRQSTQAVASGPTALVQSE
jgi:predicted dehydrogenase